MLEIRRGSRSERQHPTILKIQRCSRSNKFKYPARRLDHQHLLRSKKARSQRGSRSQRAYKLKQKKRSSTDQRSGTDLKFNTYQYHDQHIKIFMNQKLNQDQRSDTKKVWHRLELRRIPKNTTSVTYERPNTAQDQDPKIGIPTLRSHDRDLKLEIPRSRPDA